MVVKENYYNSVTYDTYWEKLGNFGFISNTQESAGINSPLMERLDTYLKNKKDKEELRKIIWNEYNFFTGQYEPNYNDSNYYVSLSSDGTIMVVGINPPNPHIIYYGSVCVLGKYPPYWKLGKYRVFKYKTVTEKQWINKDINIITDEAKINYTYDNYNMERNKKNYNENKNIGFS